MKTLSIKTIIACVRVLSYLITANPGMVSGIIFVVLISKCILIYNAEHIFICLFAICISSVRCLFRSFAIFLIGLLVNLLLSFKYSLNILIIKLLSDFYFRKMFVRT